MSRFSTFLIVSLFYVLLDLTAAHLLRVTPLWGPEVIERRYRVGHPQFHHDLAANVDLTALWGDIAYPLTTNNLGFRDSTVRTVSLRSDRPRVLVIGDSFTEGLGVAYPDTYVGILAQRMTRKGFEVLNAGVMSYSPSIYYRKVKYLLEETRLDIDYVLVAIDLSDIPDEATGYRLDAQGNVVSRSADAGLRLRASLKEYSLLFHVADLIRDVLRTRLADPASFSDWTTDERAFRNYGAEGLMLASARMDDLFQLLRDRKIGLAITVYPYPAQVRRHDTSSKQARFWAEWARQRGVPCYDLFPIFLEPDRSGQSESKNFIPHDVHWNARGHRLVAAALLRAGLADTVASYLTHGWRQGGG